MSDSAMKKVLEGSLLISVFALLAVVFNQTIADTAKICWNVEDYSHGLLLPFITGYFLWERRRQLHQALLCQGDAQRRTNISLIGVLLLAIGLALQYVGHISMLLFISWLAFFPALIGTIYLVFGSAVASLVSGPIILNFMAKPLPDALVPKLFFPLQVLAAKISAAVLAVLNVPVYLSGNIIEIPGMQLMVEEACSGLRSMMALLTVAFIVLYSVRLPFFAKLIIVFAAVGIAIALNVVRVAATGILAYFVDHQAAEGFFHEFSGMIVFILGLLILFFIGRTLEKVFTRKPAA